MFKRKGVKGIWNKVKKNCKIGTARHPLDTIEPPKVSEIFLEDGKKTQFDIIATLQAILETLLLTMCDKKYESYIGW